MRYYGDSFQVEDDFVLSVRAKCVLNFVMAWQNVELVDRMYSLPHRNVYSPRLVSEIVTKKMLDEARNGGVQTTKHIWNWLYYYGHIMMGKE